ncbi:unnamed protein product [Meloidogyne enterolobii]|uniref:Uncharacterized protein n=1 Tax=Meloidogyne enterolobii TaxID=390850 RepID=A0ACB0XK83_MELEN
MNTVKFRFFLKNYHFIFLLSLPHLTQCLILVHNLFKVNFAFATSTIIAASKSLSDQHILSIMTYRAIHCERLTFANIFVKIFG